MDNCWTYDHQGGRGRYSYLSSIQTNAGGTRSSKEDCPGLKLHHFSVRMGTGVTNMSPFLPFEFGNDFVVGHGKGLMRSDPTQSKAIRTMLSKRDEFGWKLGKLIQSKFLVGFNLYKILLMSPKKSLIAQQ